MSDDLDRYLDDFGATLARAAAPTAPRPRPRLRLALLGGASLATAAAVAVLALLVLPAADERLDPVAQARAALAAPAGELIHTVTAMSYHRQDGRGRVLPARERDLLRTEQWATGEPARWRTVTTSAADRSESAFAGGVLRSYDRRRNRLTLIRGMREVPRTVLMPGAAQLGGDPVLELRRLLADGDLRDMGVTTVDGREVRRLTGEQRVRAGRRAVVIRTEYLVDPETSAPIRLRIASGRPGGEPHGFTETRFTTYERLPLTAESARLLRIATKPDPKVITHRIPPPPPAPAPAPRPR